MNHVPAQFLDLERALDWALEGDDVFAEHWTERGDFESMVPLFQQVSTYSELLDFIASPPPAAADRVIEAAHDILRFGSEYVAFMQSVDTIGVLPIWRNVYLDAPEDLRLDRIGLYWSIDPTKASPYWGGLHGTLHFLEGRIAVADVDWEESFSEYLAFGESESVLMPKIGAPITLVAINEVLLNPPKVGIAQPLNVPGGGEYIPDEQIGDRPLSQFAGIPEGITFELARNPLQVS